MMKAMIGQIALFQLLLPVKYFVGLSLLVYESPIKTIAVTLALTQRCIIFIFWSLSRSLMRPLDQNLKDHGLIT